MKKQAVVFVCIFLLIGLNACSVPTPVLLEPTRPSEEPPYKTVSVMLTSTAEAETPLPTIVSAQPRTPTVHAPTQAPQLPTITLEASSTPFVSNHSGVIVQPPCNVAHPGRPMDITVPDETQFTPGEYFSKTWRLVNAGSCAWTENYAAVWFSGDDLGVVRVLPVQGTAIPGTSMDITVEMVAPQQPGVYQSNWKLRSDRGELFGIGPEGDSPFWVRIVVVPVETETPTPAPPEATDTPLVYSGGFFSLMPTDGVDLDNAALNQLEEDDLRLERVEDETNLPVLLIQPVNGARLAFFGLTAPEQNDCMLANGSEEPLDLGQVQPGVFLCYRTTMGLPGRAYISGVDPETNQVDLEFLTWAVP